MIGEDAKSDLLRQLDVRLIGMDEISCDENDAWMTLIGTNE